MKGLAQAVAALGLLAALQLCTCLQGNTKIMMGSPHGRLGQASTLAFATPSRHLMGGLAKAVVAGRRGAALAGLSMVQTPPKPGSRRASKASSSGGTANTETVSFRDMSRQMQSVMNDAEADERVKILMDGMRCPAPPSDTRARARAPSPSLCLALHFSPEAADNLWTRQGTNIHDKEFGMLRLTLPSCTEESPSTRTTLRTLAWR